jgi:hypothetical protein
MLVKLSQSSPHRGRISTIGGPFQWVSGKLLQRVHHRRRGAHVDVGETERHRVLNRTEVGAADVDRDDEIGVERGDTDRQVVDHAAVYAQTIAHAPGREIAGQGARGVHGVLHVDVAETRGPPNDRRAALEVDGVDEERHRQVLERAARDDRVRQIAQRVLEIDRGRPHAIHQHSEVIDSEQVAAADRLRSRRQAR